MSSQATPRIGYSEALASGQFRALFASQLVSVSGTSIAAVALTILVYQRTASPLLASLTFALGFLPYLLGGGLLSGVIDRVRPRRLVVSCDLVSAVLAATMAWPAIPVTILLTLLLAIGTLASVSSGARVALARSTVSEGAYVPARSLMRIAAQVAQLGGNAAGGALLVVLTPSGALLVNAGSFAFSAAAVRFAVADHANAGQPSQARLLRDSLRGAQTILAHAELRRLLLVGWWLVALPVGLIAGDIAGVRLLTPRQQRRLVAPAAAAGFVPYLAFAFDPPIPIALLLLVASGACGLYMLGLDARVRDAVPPQLFARTMTLNSAGLMTLQGVGFTLAGAIAQGIGPAIAIAIAGSLGLTATTARLRSDLRPRRGRIDRWIQSRKPRRASARTE